MNIRNYTGLVLLAFAAVLSVSSCAKEAVEDKDAVEKRLIEAHVSVFYKDTITPLPSGTYVITNKKGTGQQIGQNSAVYIRYSTLDLRNNYLTSSLEEVAKNVGGFSFGNYYGPVLFEMGNLTMMKGLEEAFLTLREGANVRILLPSWASVFDFPNSDRYHSSPTFYDVEVVQVIENFPRYELDSLQRFSSIHYDGLDSLAAGFYFKSLEVGAGDSVKVGKTVSFNYVGKLLNGFVFDTNIEDSARKYRIYSSEKSYRPVSFEVTEVGGSNPDGDSYVDGFVKALLMMNYGGKAVTFFGSEWGYGATVQSFGKRQQLHFYIEVLEE